MQSCADAGIFNNSYDSDYIPSVNDPSFTLRYRLHVMQYASSDPRNFEQGNSAHEAYLNGVELKLKEIFYNNPDPVYEGVTNPLSYPTITDTRIRFERIGDIIYTESVNGWNNSDSGSPSLCGSYNFDNYGIDKDCALNIFIIGSDPDGDGCVGSFFESGSYVIMDLWDYYNAGIPWWDGGRLLAHELGHALGLHHSWLTVSQFPDIYSPLITQCSNSSSSDCSNNLMGYGFPTETLSPRQSGHIRELVLNFWRSKMLALDYDPSQTITITGNETWSRARVSAGDIVVENGATLTITCRVLMAGGARIKVEAGGHLIVDGGLITTKANSCGGRERWAGIYVEGNPYVAQTATNQGKVELINGATLSHASNAISTSRAGSDQYAGGIVQCVDAVFENNWRSVEFLRYNYQNNASYFENCQFILDEDFSLRNGTSYLGHVTAYDVHGVDFNNCQFSFENTSVTDPKQGILVIDAGISVYGTNTTFDGFRYGISATVNNGRILNVLDADFTNNSIGIYTANSNYFTIRDCSFSIGENEFIPPGLNANRLNHGVFVENGTGYMIEDNEFSHAGPPNPDYGLLIVESGDDPNRVRENEFYDIRYAAIAQDLNRDLSNSLIGLEYHCNRFENAAYALLVHGDGITLTPNGGICDNQGRSQDPAGNTFYNNIVDLYNDFDYTINYWYYDNDPPQIPTTVSAGFVAKSTRSSTTCTLKTGEAELAFDGDYVPLDLLNKKNSLVGKYEVIEHHIREEEWNTANQLIAALAFSERIITEKQLEEYEDFVLLKGIQHQLYLSGRSWSELTASELASLVAIADRYRGRAGNQARALVNWFHGGSYYPNYTLPPSLDESIEESIIPAVVKTVAQNFTDSQSENRTLPSIQCNPNPVTTNSLITISGLLDQEEAEMELLNVNGKIVFRKSFRGNNELLLDESSLPNGIYFCRLITARAGSITIKVILSR